MRLWVFALLLAMLLAPPAAAGDAAISVDQVEIRATAGAMTATGGYARIVNSGHADVTLVELMLILRPRLKSIRFRRGWRDENEATQGGLVIPAHGKALLKPGGNHLMFMGLTGAMKPGAMQHITLHFDDGHTVLVMAKVKASRYRWRDA